MNHGKLCPATSGGRDCFCSLETNTTIGGVVPKLEAELAATRAELERVKAERRGAFVAFAARVGPPPSSVLASAGDVAIVSREESDLAEMRARAERAEALVLDLDAGLRAQVAQLTRDLADALVIAGTVDPDGSKEALLEQLRRRRRYQRTLERRLVEKDAVVDALVMALEAEREEHAATAAKLREIVEWWTPCDRVGGCLPATHDEPCHGCDLNREAWDILSPEPATDATEAA